MRDSKAGAARFFVCVIACAMSSTPGRSIAGEILRIGDSAGGVSADGSVVSGSFFDAVSQQLRAYRWQAGASQNLGVLSGQGGSFGTEVSAEGNVVVGQSGTFGFRWSAATSMVSLGAASEIATNASSDGSVAVGLARQSGNFRGFRWTAGTGLVVLGDLPGGFNYSKATAVAADGSLVVGTSSATDGDRAVRWIGANTTPQTLGLLRAGDDFSEALDISANGQVIVGVSGAGGVENEAFRWTASNGFQGLGDLPGGLLDSVAGGVNADGSVIVGTGNPGLDVPDEGFYWSEAAGMRPLWDVALAAGVDLSSWRSLTQATDVSANGSVIVGSGVTAAGETAGFRLVLPEPTGLMVVATVTPILRRRRRRG